jgi:hypothetical protein
MGLFRNRLLVVVALAAVMFSTPGCGTLLYPARLDATASTRLDTRVVILDCLWLFAGVIPGVVALAADFLTGAAYFSEGEAKVSSGDTVSVKVYGAAPADCMMELRLVDTNGVDLAKPARLASVTGEELDSDLALVVPGEIENKEATLVLAVGGREQVRWTVVPR